IMRLGFAENAIWYLNIAATIALLAVLIRQRLARTYPLMTAYMAVALLQSLLGVLLLSVLHAGRAYFWDYALGMTAKLILSVFVVLDLTKESLRPHPALARFSQMATGFTLAAVAALAAVALILNPPAMKSDSAPEVQYFLAFERTMDLAMLLLLLTLAAFLL